MGSKIIERVAQRNCVFHYWKRWVEQVFEHPDLVKDALAHDL